ncbi:MAG: glycosyltransferase family 39 protein [Anaerolineae bacterium]
MNLHVRLFLLVVLVWLGFGLRLYKLDAVALRGDEAFSAQRWAGEPLSVSLTTISALEPHPPLTYILFRAWGVIFGIGSAFALRLLPVLFNVLGIVAIYALAQRLLHQPQIALLAGLLWSIHPFEIWHAQDFRNYGIWAGLNVMTLWFALRVIQRRHWRDWVLYSVMLLVTCLIFYNELITVGVLGLYVLIAHWRDWRFTLRWSLLNGGIIALTFSAFVIFQGDLISGGGYAGTTGAFQLAQIWQRFVPVLQFGDTLSLTLQDGTTTVWWALISPLTLAMIIYTGYVYRQRSLLLILLAILPMIVLALVSTVLNIFRPRYIMQAVPAYLIITSATIYALAHQRHLRSLVLVLLVVWGSLNVISLNNHYHQPAYQKAPDWRALIAYLNAHTQADDLIIQTSVDASFGLYYDLANVPAPQTALPTNFTQPIPDILAEMAQIDQQFERVWIVGQTFPEWQNTGVVENWAYENWQTIQDTRVAGLPVRAFMDWSVHLSELSETPLAIFDEVITLADAELLQSPITQQLTVLLYWQPSRLTDVPYTVFVQLVGDVNPATGEPLWAQDDHPPQDGRVTTDQWALSTIYRDVYTLDLSTVVSGTYQLIVGFYDPVSGDRLPLTDGTDAYPLGTITIE